MDYVLGYFGKTISGARRAYLSFVKAGLGQGQGSSLLLGGAGSGDVAFGFSEAFWDEPTRGRRCSGEGGIITRDNNYRLID